MFEKTLQDKFKAIFGVQKVTYDHPSEVKEQNCLFVEIEDSKNKIKDGEQVAKVMGRAFIFARNEKMPFGFFSKQIQKASSELTNDIHFSDFEANTKYFRDLVQRGFNFTYFYRGQYDPELGKLTNLDFTLTTEEP